MRILLAVACMLFGIVFLPSFLVGCLIVWSVFADIREEPERKRTKEKIAASLNRPIDVESMRETCESPAEEAFFDAMVSFYQMSTGPGCIAADGIQLRTQIGLGALRIGRGSAWRQFRGDFLVDETLVIEIDGARWHGTPEAKARDFARDQVIKADGYTVLRIPASIVFNNPNEAIRRVETARQKIKVTI